MNNGRYSWLRGDRLGLWLLPCLFATLLPAASIREVLAEFETGATSPTRCAGDRAVGRNQEVSRYQILPSVWRQYTRSREFSNPSLAWSVAERILTDRMNGFRQATGRACDSVDLYLLWNAPGAYAQAKYNREKLSKVVLTRAERFANLALARSVTAIQLADAK